MRWTVVDAGDNAADTEVMLEGARGYGSVGYRHRIARHEVTHGQYIEFLNTVVAADPNGRYNTDLPDAANIYPRLIELFRRADERHNSGLFHFAPEKGRSEAPDTRTPDLSIDDKVLREIIKWLYYPECPYEFSVMPAEILGQVYEQFLGKVIRLTAGHRAVIEEKPEVKKAGGAYYTPSYIVDYIVQHTVGKLVEAAGTPNKVGKLRILDPACGSGSFLLGAYQYLLDWHLDYYLDNDPASWTKKKTPPIYEVVGRVQSRSPQPDKDTGGLNQSRLRQEAVGRNQSRARQEAVCSSGTGAEGPLPHGRGSDQSDTDSATAKGNGSMPFLVEIANDSMSLRHLFEAAFQMSLQRSSQADHLLAAGHLA